MKRRRKTLSINKEATKTTFKSSSSPTTITIPHLCLLFTLASTTILPITCHASSPSSTASNDNSNSSTWHFLSPSDTPQSQFRPTGQIVDASCNVEELEEANDSQLYSILRDLRHTAFFKSFMVDLDESCPLDTVSSFGVDSKEEDKEMKQHTTEKEKEKGFKVGTQKKPNFLSKSSKYGPPSALSSSGGDGKCASEGLPDAEPDAEPACGVAMDDSDSLPWKQSQSSFVPKQEKEQEKETLPSKPADITKTENKKQVTEEEEEEECTGGAVADEMDEDAPPLCHLTEEETTEYFTDPRYTISKTPIRDLLSSALSSLGFYLPTPKTKRETFQWSQPSDPIITEPSTEGEPCDDDENRDASSLPETFWLDMCSNIKAGDGLKVVNLSLNPERNTGYNGTHIWNAIYEQSCIDALDGLTDQPMCYEERVLHRLLSGLHTSTTLSIAKNYYPPNKRKGRTTWEPNPAYFWKKFESHPDYIRNLHFSYVVLLRALKKASPFLHQYEIRTGNIVEDETAEILLKRLLDSTILKSCSSVFEAFDEKLMFRDAVDMDGNGSGNDYDGDMKSTQITSLQQNFKYVFHNVSSILDCVQCQQCKLHGKMAMLGYGTALKILFLPREELIASSLSRNEIVAFINTVAKMSESLKEVRELTTLYWASKNSSADKDKTSFAVSGSDVVDAAVAAIAALAKSGMISEERETEMVQLALSRHSDLLVLAKHYGTDLNKFLLHTKTIGSLGGEVFNKNSEPDAIVVGSGLAGLAATLNILDRGGKVMIIEKEHRLGGNSNKASSGINACCPTNGTHDDIETFKADTIRSAGDAVQYPLVDTLVGNSAAAVTWLRERVGVDLSLVAQLGGHQRRRTHRPNNGMVGAEVIYGMQKAVKKYEKSGMVEILVDTKVKNLMVDDESDEKRVIGVEVEYLSTDDNTGQKQQQDRPTQVKAPNVILATGGFAADRTAQSYLAEYRPELLKMPATAGDFSTGDGIGLAKALGAGLVDMDKIQIHPTGWVNPKDPHNPNKVLAAELMRGVGGVLINKQGKRFCNELGTRAYVTDMMLGHDSFYAETKKWNASNEIPTFSIVLSSSAAEDGKKHVDHYIHKGLLTKIHGISSLADWMGIDVGTIRQTLIKYQEDGKVGIDEWGKTSFQGLPQPHLDEEIFYAGTVTPVLHYCMGGITIDKEGYVLDEHKNIIPGLHAAGEVTGGVHGNNRLGGNSLLECTVYGTIVGKKIPIRERKMEMVQPSLSDSPDQKSKLREVSISELAEHNTPDDCWVAIHGYVYDLTEFAEEHPAGADSIFKLGGQDGTEAFQSVHNEGMMEDFEEDKIGILAK